MLLILRLDAKRMKLTNRIFIVLCLMTSMLLMGCNQDYDVNNLIPEGEHTVGIHNANFRAETTDELKVIVENECKSTCDDMDYVYSHNRYTVYTEDGMYVARDPKCICYDKKK